MVSLYLGVLHTHTHYNRVETMVNFKALMLVCRSKAWLQRRRKVQPGFHRGCRKVPLCVRVSCLDLSRFVFVEAESFFVFF